MTALKVSSSGEVEMMCQAILKAFNVKFIQAKPIPTMAADWIKVSGMSNFGIVIQCG